MSQDEVLQSLEELVHQINEADELNEALLLKLKEFRDIDIANVFHHLKRGMQNLIFNSFSDERASEILAELDDVVAIEILRDLTREKIASLLNLLPPDEGADMIALSEEKDQPHILTHMDDDLADRIRDLATYPPESAGGLMTSHFVSVAKDENVRSVLLTVKTSDQAEMINYIYIVDPKGKLEGVISVRELLQADLHQTIAGIMEKDFISVPLDLDQEEVSRLANKYHLQSLPVIDNVGVLKGIITLDDLMEVLEEESSEDIYKMAGEITLHPTQQPVMRRIAARFPWLMVTLGGTIVAAGIIRIFETIILGEGTFSSLSTLGDLIHSAFTTIDNEWTFLLCFLPMIGGMAGNVGLQSSTVMVRGLATGEVDPSFFSNILSKEIIIATVIGLISGIIIGFLVWIVFPEHSQKGFVIGLSLFCAILCAAFLGTIMPFLCLILKVDPAYASGPLLTTMNDIVGFLIFFGIACVLLPMEKLGG